MILLVPMAPTAMAPAPMVFMTPLVLVAPSALMVLLAPMAPDGPYWANSLIGSYGAYSSDGCYTSTISNVSYVCLLWPPWLLWLRWR